MTDVRHEEDYETTAGDSKRNSESETANDPWALTDDVGDYTKWTDMTKLEQLKAIFKSFIKFVLILGCLYLFVCSLSLLGSAFQVLAGKTAGTIFGNHSFLANPVTGLIVGILVTVLVQSSSTSTSIITSMVGANILTVHAAIPIVMGANIGTSVTNTIVSLAQSVDVNQFRKAFAGATVHDIFNLLAVIILLPLEVASGVLEKLTRAIIESIPSLKKGKKSPDILKVITKPLTDKIIKVNKKVIKIVAKGKSLPPGTSMVKSVCGSHKAIVEELQNLTVSNTSGLVNITVSRKVNVTKDVDIPCRSPNDFLFANTGMSDGAVGAILLIVSLIILCVCLITMVKLLQSMMKGKVAKIIKKVINTNFPYPFGWLTGYLAILVGAGLTFVVQSSSVFTSTITPLVGVGVISLKRMYPLTLGANIGTTTTSILAALAQDEIANALQIAFCHFFFNIFGIIIWYPIPFMRNIPIKGAKALGNTTAKYRWFAVVYLIVVFFIIPAVILGLSLAHIWAMGAVMILVVVIVLFIIVVNVLQVKRPKMLPRKLQSWDFLPAPLHSLKPYDRIVMRVFFWCPCCKAQNTNRTSNDENQSHLALSPIGAVNPVYQLDDIPA
uniref:sodium-dependent phosphate transport protein 2B-like isoform X2 n=1 Tax=Ciona intestinalis TaxID=7719 RepID=UPI000180B010|nr:sodium-dependent phosphate transport protein 2B-like isoform X2 [Ciona intestinalis]|eukprot:XP_018673358.1 sodium-dependent phosphate transport protein 2B-like isoform X2 [Ciona intestinalis]